MLFIQATIWRRQQFSLVQTQYQLCTWLAPSYSLFCHQKVAQSWFRFDKSHPIVARGENWVSSLSFKTWTWFGLGLWRCYTTTNYSNTPYCVEPLPSNTFFFDSQLQFLKDENCNYSLYVVFSTTEPWPWLDFLSWSPCFLEDLSNTVLGCNKGKRPKCHSFLDLWKIRLSPAH